MRSAEKKGAKKSKPSLLRSLSLLAALARFYARGAPSPPESFLEAASASPLLLQYCSFLPPSRDSKRRLASREQQETPSPSLFFEEQTNSSSNRLLARRPLSRPPGELQLSSLFPGSRALVFVALRAYQVRKAGNWNPGEVRNGTEKKRVHQSDISILLSLSLSLSRLDVSSLSLSFSLSPPSDSPPPPPPPHHHHHHHHQNGHGHDPRLRRRRKLQPPPRGAAAAAAASPSELLLRGRPRREPRRRLFPNARGELEIILAPSAASAKFSET